MIKKKNLVLLKTAEHLKRLVFQLHNGKTTVVHVASPFAGEEPKSTVQRYDRSTKTYIDID